MKFLIKILIAAIVLGALCGGAYTGYVYMSWQSNKAKALDKLSKYKQLIDRTEEMKKGYVYSTADVDISAKIVDLPTRIYDRNDKIIGEFFEQKREIVPYDFIPEWIVKGVVASEDREFYEHNGVNYRGILRALAINVANMSVVQGGSTITQQLAKVLFTDMERNLKRKIYEVFCAGEIENLYDKQDILSMYLNLIYFGNGAYGVESASKMFFGKSINECDPAECAAIIATISSPKTYSPLSNLDNSLRKTKRILQSMTDAGFMNEQQADTAYNKYIKEWEFVLDKNGKPQSSLIGSFVFSSYRVNRAPFFNEMIRRQLVEKFGDESIKKGGLSIYTTIDAEMQDAALSGLRAGIAAQREYHKKIAASIKNKDKAAGELEKSENIEGALISLEPFTGEIITYCGGYDFTAKNQNDHVSQIVRQPGSSFKPVIYVSAIQDKDITPSAVFRDEPVTFKGGYSPKNASQTYAGDMIVRDALRRSVNVVAVKILDKTGYDTISSVVKNSLDLSDAAAKKRFGRTLSLALGTYEISPLENCVLHSVIANGGDFIKPYGIRYVKDYSGNTVWNPESDTATVVREKRDKVGKIIDPKACAIVVSMMKGVFEKGGTAYYAARGLKLPVAAAGKTGTSTNYNDAWFAGYTPRLVTVVWVGNKKGAISLGGGRSGSSVAAPVWVSFMKKNVVAPDNEQDKDFAIPDAGLSTEHICMETGLVATEGCPDTAWQLYYEGSEPGDFCGRHGGSGAADSRE